MLFSSLVSFLFRFVCILLFAVVVVVVVVVVVAVVVVKFLPTYIMYIYIFLPVVYRWQGRALIPSVIPAPLCNDLMKL